MILVYYCILVYDREHACVSVLHSDRRDGILIDVAVRLCISVHSTETMKC